MAFITDDPYFVQRLIGNVNICFNYYYSYLQLVGCEDGFLSLMDDSGETREDLKMPEEPSLEKDIKAGLDRIDAEGTTDDDSTIVSRNFSLNI